MFFILKPVRLLLKAFVTESTPRQMSLGLALGVFVGLVPKGNLLAIALGILLAATRVNLAIAACAVAICTFASGGLDSVFDQIGGYVLSQPSLQNLWTTIYNTPFMPWTDFNNSIVMGSFLTNNSIVMGSFLTGLVLIWPVHRISRPVFEKYSEHLSRHARRWWVARVLLGAEWANRISTVE